MCIFSIIEVLEREMKEFKGMKANETKNILDKGMENKNKEDMKQMQKIETPTKSRVAVELHCV